MFNNNKKAVVTYDSEAEKVVTLIGTGAVCDGPFSAKDSTRIDGTINGAVRIDGSLIVGQTGKITGNVQAQNVFLAGEIAGNIDGSRSADCRTTIARHIDITTCLNIIASDIGVAYSRDAKTKTSATCAGHGEIARY